MRILLLFVVIIVAQLSQPAFAANKTKSIIRLRDSKREYEGRLLSLTNRNCWLQARDGQLHELRIKNLRHFKRTDDKFAPLDALDFRATLRTEFGRKLEFKTSGNYIVLARKGKAKDYARVFDEIYGAFRREFRTRGFNIQTPEFPLVAVVFPTRREFFEYAHRDRARIGAGVVGYYQRLTNRVALYDEVRTDEPPRMSTLPEESSGDSAVIKSVFNVEGNLRDTMIHEAVHQIAFNTGIHNRRGKTPLWVIEGLATMFEAPGIRHHVSRQKKSSRWNRERLMRFQEYLKTRRKRGDMEAFIRDDAEKFQSAALDSYAEAWALTYFLFETRGEAYAKFLRRTAERDPFAEYSSQQRVDDFKAEFGDDLARLESTYLRFMGRLSLKR